MSFNRRYVSKKILISRYKSGGMDSVISYLNVDALIIELSIENIINLIHKDLKLAEKEILKIIENESN